MLNEGQRAWEVMTPIAFGEEVAGSVAALFSLQRADALSARSRTWSLGLTAGAALVMALLMSLAVFVVVERPLQRLMEAIREVRAGTSEATAPIASRDELGRLAGHFNEMMSRINRFSDELQGRVDEATAELARRYAEVEALNAQLFRRAAFAQSRRAAGRGRAPARRGRPRDRHAAPLGGRAPRTAATGSRRGWTRARARRRLAIIEGEIARVEQIIAQLLDLTRRPPGEPGEVDVNRLVRDTVDLVRPGATGGGIELVLTLDPALAPVRGHADPLQQVVLNLLVNAIDATPAGGRVSLTTRTADASTVLEVVDSGHGIPDAQLKEIFEPFFSTKEPGRGTGLGLFIVSQIVREHHGHIEVESEEGRGTTMRVILPGDPPA